MAESPDFTDKPECPECNATCVGGCSETCGGACKNGCYSTCKGTCSGCSGSCQGKCLGCSGTCTNYCQGTCKGSCSTVCQGTCVVACSETCKTGCKGNCYTSCDTSCYKECTDQCKGYCSSICQTYCETQQTFTENLDIPNAIGQSSFSWTNPVTAPTETSPGSTILIKASDWNTLKSRIAAATVYCGGTVPSGPNASSDPTSANNIISAAKYNDLADGLNIANVYANTTIISAEVINKLKNAYNSRQIIDTLPKGQYSGGINECCQSKQICMESTQLLDHQKITEKCKDQIASSCGNQTAGKQTDKTT